MKRWSILLFFFFLICRVPKAASLRQLPVLIDLSQKEHKLLQGGKVVSKSEINTTFSKKKQSLFFYVGSVHKYQCQRTMRKLSLYEEYKNYVTFIKVSEYNPKTQVLHLKFDSDLMPYPLSVIFNLPRIKEAGTYKFRFDRGFLKGLVGQIKLQDLKSGCLMEVKTDWLGPHTKIPDVVFEVFTQTLGRLAMEKLMRLSRI